MKPVDEKSWKFAVPESFKIIGLFLKEKYAVCNVKSNRSSAISKIPAGQDNAIKICFNTLIVLCDRIMKTDSQEFGKLSCQPRLKDLFVNEGKSEFPDFAIAHAPEGLIEDQSRVYDWKPLYG